MKKKKSRQADSGKYWPSASTYTPWPAVLSSLVEDKGARTHSNSHKEKSNFPFISVFFSLIVLPGDRNLCGHMALLMFVVCCDLCFMFFKSHGRMPTWMFAQAYPSVLYSRTGLQPVALTAPCVSLCLGVSPYPQDFQGFPSVSWHCTFLFPLHMHTWGDIHT